MDDTTQKLVDDAWDDAWGFRRETRSWSEESAARTWFDHGVKAALEAAQRPPVAEPDNHHNADVCPFCTRNREEREAAIRAEALAQRPPVSGDYTHVVNLARASEAADKGFDVLVNYLADLPTIEEWRPPVSPEMRDAGIDVATVAVEGLLASIEKGSDHGPRDIAEAALDAARFSFPSQPVYDEEKIARWLHNWARVTPGEPSEFIQNLASALVAALRGGELTREEANRG